MQFSDIQLPIQFKFTKKPETIALKELGNCLIDFLEHFGEEAVVGKEFATIIGKGDGESKLQRLLQATGHDILEFCSILVAGLGKANHDQPGMLVIGNVALPHHLLMAVLELLVPGHKFIMVKSVRQLEKLTNFAVPETQWADLQKVIDLYPVRLSLHTIRQMRLSPAVAYQFLPFVQELDKHGLVHTWVGQFHRGIIEQMYQNRVIFILNMSCPVYCRFCFRKHKECRNQKAPTKGHVKDALNYIKESPAIKEIVLTGGDPFMNKATLTSSIEGLKLIDHVQTLRVATRSISYYPSLFYQNDSFWLNYLKIKSLELRNKGKRIEIATHFIHPDEISLESLDIISDLVKNGIAVYVQTPFLKNCNDGGSELEILFRQLRGAGAEIHYVYIPCSPIQGNSLYWASIADGLKVATYLRAHLSDRAMPKMCTATAVGKIDWNSSGWAVETDADDSRYLWLRTPYSYEYFESFAPILQISAFARTNQEGTLDIKYLADIGDRDLLAGARETIFSHHDNSYKLETTEKTVNESIERLQMQVVADQRHRQAIVGSSAGAGIFRIHKTRVEVDLQADSQELERSIALIANDQRISDVVLSSRKDTIESLYHVIEMANRLRPIAHLKAIRLRSWLFNYNPACYTKRVLDRLASCNHLDSVNPKRLEIETQFLHSGEFRPEHRRLADALRHHGITVYNNTPLLGFINDNEEEIARIAYQCRLAGIEFQNLYLAGLPVQEDWNDERPIDLFDIITIASNLRCFGSGREIPHYLVRTRLGEIDYGMPGQVFFNDAGVVYARILPYDLEYYQALDPDYQLPPEAKRDENNRLIIPVPGVKLPANSLAGGA